jgi:RHS repeat-associated protein
MHFDSVRHRTHDHSATAAAGPKTELLPLVLLAFLLALQCFVAIGVYDPRAPIAAGPALAFTTAIDSVSNRLTFLAPGIVTGWPRLAESAAEERLGETHRRIFLSGDGGSSRARRPEGPGRKNRWMEGELLAQIDGSGNVVYVHNSHIGAPQKITDPSRTLVWDQIIEPFGEVSSTPTTTTPTAWRFPGQFANANNSLSHNGARDYDPSCACYVESDPAGLAGGLNPVSYAGQNPTQSIDPLGLWQITATAGFGGMASVTAGYNSGQLNAGVFFGVGVGGSLTLDPNDSGAEDPHAEYGVRGSCDVGAIRGMSLDTYASTLNSSDSLSYGVPHTPISFAISDKNGIIDWTPSISYPVGASLFLGAGVTVYH